MQGEYKKYTELSVWLEAKKLTVDIYRATQIFPKQEQFGLLNQIRRCAVSVPSNIAEGCGRNHAKDSLQFFYISRGSLYELETQIYLSNDLGYINLDVRITLLHQLENVRKLLNGFIRYYKASIVKDV